MTTRARTAEATDTARGAKEGLMSRKRAGRVLLLTSAVCMVAYMLTAPRGVSPLLVWVGGVLFYVGIAALLACVVLRWTGQRSEAH